ncbi:MAG TPA: hypothetical protein VGA08_03845 [Candidatus Saccharimonadales bacterium]
MTSGPEGGQGSTPELTHEARIERLERLVGKEALLAATNEHFNEVPIFVFPDGKRPERKTDGAIGYDVYARAIVHNNQFDPELSYKRLTRFDFFASPDDKQLRKWVHPDESNPNQSVLLLPPGQQVLIGVGFATAPNYPLFYWLAPRSGLAMNNITIANAPGTVDPDYRGEAGVLLQNNSTEHFEVGRHMRVAQAIFMPAWIPRLTEVDSHVLLGSTQRQERGFGSTGTYD